MPRLSVFSGLLAPLKPYLLWIKLGLAAAALAGAAWAGHEWCDRGHAAAALDAAHKHVTALEAAHAQYEQKLAERRNLDRMLIDDLQNKQAGLARANARLVKEVEDATKRSYVGNDGKPVDGPVFVSSGFVRVWNAKLLGQACAAGVSAGGTNTAGVSCADTGPSSVGTGDLLANHAVNATQCLIWRNALIQIKTWEASRGK